MPTRNLKARKYGMEAARCHRDLVVWQRAIELAAKVYAATRLLPSDERFDLSQQLRRSVVAIASNIAEGSARRTRAEFLHFLHSARGALSELETQMLIAVSQGYFDFGTSLPTEIADVRRSLNELIATIRNATQLAHAKACAPSVGLRQRG